MCLLEENCLVFLVKLKKRIAVEENSLVHTFYAKQYVHTFVYTF